MVKSLRYEIEYRNISVQGNQAEVEVFLDGSFELAAESGDRYRRVNDYHRFVLEHENDHGSSSAACDAAPARRRSRLLSSSVRSACEQLVRSSGFITSSAASISTGRLPVAVMTTSGMPAMSASCFCSLRNCQPSMTGIIRSSRITHGRGLAGLEVIERLAAVADAGDLVAFVLQHFAQRIANVRIVIYDQDAAARP